MIPHIEFYYDLLKDAKGKTEVLKDQYRPDALAALAPELLFYLMESMKEINQ